MENPKSSSLFPAVCRKNKIMPSVSHRIAHIHRSTDIRKTLQYLISLFILLKDHCRITTVTFRIFANHHRKDYSINESLFHWQSQSTTAENSSTGQRYIHHKERGSKVLLFVREFKADRMTGGAEAYTYLGTANYVKHTGSRPMNITWQLDRPIPAKFLKKTNKLVVG